MTIERARVQELPKPWGVIDGMPWSEAGHDGLAIGEICFERSGLAAAGPALLLKVLLTRQPLSIQVHPDDALARSMGLSNGKTEAWFVLSARPGAKVALGLKQSMTKLQLRAAITDGSIADRVAWRGVAAGDVVSVPAGTIHAIGAGLVIAEIQQRSDTTFRLFDHGRSRELHIDVALAAASAEPADTQPEKRQLTSERTLLAANAHFVFERVELAPDSTWCVEACRETWLLVVDGAARAGEFEVVKGNAVFAEGDRVLLRAGAGGVVCVVAYTAGEGPISQLLHQLPQCGATVFQESMPMQVARIATEESAAPALRGTIQ